MATQPQLTPTRAETNRQNAQSSTGPRTQEGKQRVRTNALKHGLTAKDIFLAEGESECYEKLHARLIGTWLPQSACEHELVLTLRDAYWRMHSIPALHINLLTLSTQEHLEQCAELSDNPAIQRSAAQAAGYRANARLFDQLSRHEGRLNRLIQQTEHLLRLIAQTRLEDELHARLEAQKAAQRPANPTPTALANSATKQSQPAPRPAPAHHDHIDCACPEHAPEAPVWAGKIHFVPPTS